MIYDYAVIGNGLMGSAAGRYLTMASSNILIIGQSEPEDKANHDGVYASHYDQGRLTRPLSQDPIWSEIARLAMQNYGSLEEQSGVPFHGAVGRVYANCFSDEERQALLEWITAVQQTYDIAYQFFDNDDPSWRKMFPYLEFPEGYGLFYEPAPAGYINPRSMLKAQNVIAQQQGATLIDAIVTQIKTSPDGVQIRTADGQNFAAQKALVACGAFTNFYELLPEPIPLRLKTESMVWGEVSEETAVQLQKMPGLGYNIDDPHIDDVYVAPPIRYPDGTYKIKLGCNSKEELWPESLDEAQTWFRQGVDKQDRDAMANALQTILPEVSFGPITAHCCIVTYTPSGYPTIDQVPSDDNGRLFVATGGNGTGAQGSDTLGRLAAGLMMDGRWIETIPRRPFLATHRWGDVQHPRTKAQQRALEQA